MNIDELRKEIADIDDEILTLFEKRLELASQVGEYKKENNMPVKNPEVEREKLQKLLSECKPENREYVREFFEKIFDISCKIQN